MSLPCVTTPAPLVVAARSCMLDHRGYPLSFNTMMMTMMRLVTKMMRRRTEDTNSTDDPAGPDKPRAPAFQILLADLVMVIFIFVTSSSTCELFPLLQLWPQQVSQQFIRSIIVKSVVWLSAEHVTNWFWGDIKFHLEAKYFWRYPICSYSMTMF